MENGSFLSFAIIFIPLLFYWCLKWHYGYWTRRNVPGEEPRLLFGNMEGLSKKAGPYELNARIYKKFKGKAPLAGYFQYLRPAIIPLDLELIKNILIKDFKCFPNRGLYYNERDDPLSGNLFFLEDEKWKTLRAKLTPAFTSGKIKLMLSPMVGVGECLVEVLSKRIEDNPNVSLKGLLRGFSLDAIGVCTFGLECNTLKNQNMKLRDIALSAFHNYNWSPLRVLFETFPNFARYMHIRRTPKGMSSFYINVIKQTVTMRQNETTRRNDFMDVLIDLLKNNFLTLEEIAAQSILFFSAGFESSATAMDFALYELALNQNIQDKLRQEINEIIGKHKGELTYEGMNEMTYLNKVVSETLRKHSGGIHYRRIAAVDYPTNDSKYIIPKGTLVMVPVQAIHNDPEYYPNPDVFDPERFSSEEIQKRHPMAYFPFNDGPRNCIGLRMGKMLVNVGLIMLIRNFNFSITKATLVPLEYSKSLSTLAPARPIVLKVQAV